MAGHLARKLIFAAGGVVLFIVWTSLTGSGGTFDIASSMPAVVFEGGAGTIGVELTTNQGAELVFSFEQYDESTEQSREVGGREKLDPGTHSRTIDVSPSTYIYLELGVPDATPGAEVSWSVSVDGRVVIRESDRLEEVLPPGYAFFLQAEADDVAQMRSWH